MAVSDPTVLKGLPTNVEAERSRLGAILLAKSPHNQAAEILRPEDFYLDSHRRLFLRFTEMADHSLPIDLVTLSEELMRNNELEQIGGASYVSAPPPGRAR